MTSNNKISLEKHVNLTYDKIKNQHNQLDNLKNQVKNLETELNKINEIIQSKINTEEDLLPFFKQKNQLNDKINHLKNDIYKIEHDNAELNFISENGEFIYNYFDNANDPNIVEDTKEMIQISESKNAFKEYIVKPPTQNNNIDQSQIKNCIENHYNDYLKNKMNNNKYLVCSNCGNENIVCPSENYIVCSICGYIEQKYIVDDNSQNSEVSINKTNYPYKRINHFIEWLNEFQAKETVNIPKEVYDKIINELTKLGYTSKSQLSLQVIKNVMKKIKLSKYYEHASYITSQLSGIPPPTLDHDTEECLKTIFELIDQSFEKHKPSTRINFFSYPYVLHKLFQIFGKNEYLMYFPLLKSKEKIKAQDEIWKKVCEDLGWPFYPSV